MAQKHFGEHDKAQDAAPRRKRGNARREEFLHAATEVFLSSGFSGTSVDSIIAKVGGSKRTIYSYFGNKEQLFTTVVEEITTRAMGRFTTDDIASVDLETALFSAGRRYLEVVMSPEALQLYRIVVGEGTRFPDIAAVFFENGPGKASKALSRILEEGADAWGIPKHSATKLAEHFIGMIRDDLHLKVVLGLRNPPTAAEARSSVRAAVDVFLYGIKKVQLQL
ncbi:TetR/AcrR family transcriptional regulator [Sinorhizobium meliloti]|jgi:AcrR family transcriptional regulator|uniref:TetR/AcrR family transcriptional regulator n=1 Tax=Rhizobium meliloti TaxID=382 RepID=UPI0020BEB661|nr:TetR/AcrR family transcriptional regulator [Sinorhizobium meliloti]